MMGEKGILTQSTCRILKHSARGIDFSLIRYTASITHSRSRVGVYLPRVGQATGLLRGSLLDWCWCSGLSRDRKCCGRHLDRIPRRGNWYARWNSKARLGLHVS